MSRETDIAIAQRVFGYKVRHRLFGWEMERPTIRSSSGLTCLAKEWVKVPGFSRHYAFACEVVRRMRERGWDVGIDIESGKCRMTKPHNDGIYVVNDKSHYMTDAICGAALGACAIAMEG